MSKLKLGSVEHEKPITMRIKLPATVHRDLAAYAELLKREGSHAVDPNSLIAPMLARFLATDRAFVRAKKNSK
jgi:hypothetical protein